MSIHKKMAEGAFWVLLEKLGSQIVSFAVFTIIARFIGPKEYGLVVLCYIYLAIAYTFLSSIVDGIINLNIRDDLRLSSLFWGIATSGLFLSAACFASAVPFATIMEQPRMVPLLRWFSLFPFMVSLASVPTALVTHSMNFRIFTIRTLIATSLSGIVGIVMAVKGFGAYAIVAQQITLYLIINIIIWPGSGWHPRWMFDFYALLNILKPGMKMSGSMVISFFEQQVPRLFIGHFLGAEAVGHFAFVTRICQSVQEILIYPLSIVSYPALTRLLDDAREQKKILSLLIMLSGGIAFPLVAWAMITAPIYVPLFFGAKWTPAIVLLQIFLATTACLPFITILRDCLRAYNRMGAYLKIQAFLMTGSLFTIWFLVPRGLALMMSGLVVLSLFSIPIYMRLVGQKIKITLWQDVMRLWAPAASSMVMAAVLCIFNISAYHPKQLWMHLFTDTVLGCFIYIVLYSALQFRQMIALLKFMQEGMSRRMGKTEQAEMMEDAIKLI